MFRFFTPPVVFVVHQGYLIQKPTGIGLIFVQVSLIFVAVVSGGIGKTHGFHQGRQFLGQSFNQKYC